MLLRADLELELQLTHACALAAGVLDASGWRLGVAACGTEADPAEESAFPVFAGPRGKG